MSETIKLEWKQVQDKRASEQQVTNIPDHKKATAPYNFVSLNADVAAYPAETPNLVDHSRFREGYYTGTITATIEAKTPIFIGSRDRGEFFSPLGKPVIPGSTLRGMLRQMVNILSYGKFTQFDQGRRLFTRPMADKDVQFRNWYNGQLVNPDAEDSSQKYKAFAGYLYKEGSDYFIQPARTDGSGKSFAVVKKADEQNYLGRRLTDFEYAPDPGQDGFYISSGPMITKNRKTGENTPKSRDWHVFAPDFQAHPIKVSRESIEDYKKDTKDSKPARRGEAKALDLLNWLKHGRNGVTFPDGIPVFYTVRENGYVSFGHTGLFRIAYSKTIGDHVAGEHVDCAVVDLAESMFGRIEPKADKKELPAFAGKIYVNDAPVHGEYQILESRELLLAGPRYTSFQNYLVQTHANKDGKRHWDSDSFLRGIKLYWHRKLNQNLTGNGNRNMLTPIRPLDVGSEFSFGLRFENLTDLELGALLTALRLRGEMAHKLGMAKPYGYGSVKFKKPQLILSNPRDRYHRFLDSGELHEGLEKADFKFQEEVMETFQKYIFQNVGEVEKKGANDFWTLKRMRQLSIMMRISGQIPSDSDLEYVDVKDRDRNPLPNPEDVVKGRDHKQNEGGIRDVRKELRKKGFNF